jgi:hypothetical protein
MRGWLMLVVVDMGLLVGAVLSLLTGVASIMRPQQRKQIQDFFVGMETAAAIRSLMPGVHTLLLIVSWLPWALFACLMIVFELEVALPDYALLQADESVPDYVKADVALTLYNS